MRIVHHLRALAVVFGSVAAFLQCGAGESPTAEKPNILLVSLDTLRADHLGSYGSGLETSPFLDELARRGVRFETAFVNTHSTGPSHMTLLSSRYQETHRLMYDVFEMWDSGGAADWINTDWLTTAPPNLVMLQEALSDAGYRTVGVTEGGFVSGTMGFSRGFEEYDDSSRDVRQGADKLLALLQDRLADDRRPTFAFLHTFQIHAPYKSPAEYQGLFGPVQPPAWEGSESRTPDLVMSVLERFRKKPFQIPDDVLDYIRLRYDRSIRYADDVLRDLFSELEELGFLENYLVVITSDHGEEFQERGGLEHAGFLFEELVHVPMIITGTNVPTNRLDKRLASTVDVMPTILRYSGVEPPIGIEGSNLLAAVDLPVDEQSVFMQYGNMTYAVRTARWKLVEGPALRTASPSDSVPTALYDLENDPNERHNAFERFPEEHQRLTTILREWKGRLADGATEGTRTKLSPEEIERLRSLGYVK